MTRTHGSRVPLPSVLALVCLGCGDADTSSTDSLRPVFDEAARAAVVASVDSATRSFQASQRARDGERAVGHLASDFAILADGVRMPYEEVSAAIRATLVSYSVFESTWSDLVVRALGPDAAVASFMFRDSTVTPEGEITVSTGTTTLAWERRGENWLIVFADADHNE